MKNTIIFALGITILLAIVVPIGISLLFGMGYFLGWLFVVKFMGIETMYGVYVPYISGALFTFISMAFGGNSQR